MQKKLGGLGIIFGISPSIITEMIRESAWKSSELHLYLRQTIELTRKELGENSNWTGLRPIIVGTLGREGKMSWQIHGRNKGCNKYEAFTENITAWNYSTAP